MLEDLNDKSMPHSKEEERRSALNALSLIGCCYPNSCYLNKVKGISLKNVVNLPTNRKDGKTCCNRVYDLTPKENQSPLVH